MQLLHGMLFQVADKNKVVFTHRIFHAVNRNLCSAVQNANQLIFVMKVNFLVVADGIVKVGGYHNVLHYKTILSKKANFTDF